MKKKIEAYIKYWLPWWTKMSSCAIKRNETPY